MRKTGFLLYNKVMVLSDFHCHLYGYDSGESMKALLDGFSCGGKQVRNTDAGGDGQEIRPGMIFTNIRDCIHGNRI